MKAWNFLNLAYSLLFTFLIFSHSTSFAQGPDYYLAEEHENKISKLPHFEDPKKGLRERGVGALVGLAVGDAVGVSLEFSRRPMDSNQVILDMVGNSHLYQSDVEQNGIRPGEWTDDTSMALAMGESLLRNEDFNSYDILGHWYLWMNDGYLNSRNFRKDRTIDQLETKTFDIGTTTARSLQYFYNHYKSKDVIPGLELCKQFPSDCKAANGSIMRLAPIPIFFNKLDNKAGHEKELLEYARKQSDLTHGNSASRDASQVLAYMIALALFGASKEDVLAAKGFDFSSFDSENPGSMKIKAFFDENPTWKNKKRSELKPENGDYKGSTAQFTLECALWAIQKTDNFKDAILLAINLGRDADTVGAVTGQLAGALYGREGIPIDWKKQLVEHDRIEEMAEKLLIAGDRYRSRKQVDPVVDSECKTNEVDTRFSVFPYLLPDKTKKLETKKN